MELKDKDKVNGKLKRDLQNKNKALNDVLKDAIRENVRHKRGTKNELNKRKVNDPLWVKVVLMVEENVAPLVMLLPRRWWVYSEEEGSFCQMAIKWLVSDGELVEGFDSWEEFWTVVSLYINDAIINAQNACRLRCLYKRKGERLLRDERLGVHAVHLLMMTIVR